MVSAWFELRGRPVSRESIEGLDGRSLSLPLGPRWVAAIERLRGRPTGVIAAHACVLAGVSIVDELAEKWPREPFPGNPERDWPDVLSLTAALRHVVDLASRDREAERRQRRALEMTRGAPEFPRDIPALQPLVDWEPLEAVGAAVRPRADGPDDDGGPCRFHVGWHLAARSVLREIAFALRLVLASADLLRHSEDWRAAVARCGDMGAERLRVAWERWQGLERGDVIWVEVRDVTGQVRERSTWGPAAPFRLWPRDYWPEWASMPGLLRAEIARVPVVPLPTASHEPPSSETKAEDLLPIAEAAERAGVTRDAVRGWARRRRSPLPVLTRGGASLVSLAAVIAERDAKARANPLSRGHQGRPSAAISRNPRRSSPGA